MNLLEFRQIVADEIKLYMTKTQVDDKGARLYNDMVNAFGRRIANYILAVGALVLIDVALDVLQILKVF